MLISRAKAIEDFRSRFKKRLGLWFVHFCRVFAAMVEHSSQHLLDIRDMVAGITFRVVLRIQFLQPLSDSILGVNWARS